VKRIRCEATPEQIVLTVPQAAKIIGKTERALWLDISRRRVPFHRQGSKILIFRDELFAFLKALPGVSVSEAAERSGGQ
jgi:hypothetical protein